MERRRNISISEMVLLGLFGCIIIGFILSSIVTVILQSRISQEETRQLLEQSIDEVRKDLTDQIDRDIQLSLNRIRTTLGTDVTKITHQQLLDIIEEEKISEINIVDKNAIIIDSSDESLIGFDMSSGPQAAEFLVLLGEQNYYIQEFQPMTYDKNVWKKYGGIKTRYGFIQIGNDIDLYQKNIRLYSELIANNRQIGTSGYMIVTDDKMNILSGSNARIGTHLLTTGLDVDKNTVQQRKVFKTDLNGQKTFWMYSYSNGFYIISLIPITQVYTTRNFIIKVCLFNFTILFAFLLIVIYRMIKKCVVNNIREINSDLNEISKGNLDVVVNVNQNIEFSQLSKDINKTVDSLKKLIDDAEQRNEAELEIAKVIQKSSLPNGSNPFPDLKSFSIHASMDTAKEVGGDFYDFYFTDYNKFMFLIADVSGKGIPAAMFMMTAKSIIKGYAEKRESIEKTISNANNQLCASNEAEMFITNWTGCIDLTTGIVEYVNAGHNPPLICKNGSSFEYIKDKHGFVLAGMEGYQYKKNELKLEKGDIIFLYTDGITEAMNETNDLYGEERLCSVLNQVKDKPVEEICEYIRQDIKTFAGKAPQSDDITMIAFKYEGNISNIIL